MSTPTSVPFMIRGTSIVARVVRSSDTLVTPATVPVTTVPATTVQVVRTAVPPAASIPSATVPAMLSSAAVAPTPVLL